MDRVSYHCPPLPSQGPISVKFPREGPVVYCDIPVCLMILTNIILPMHGGIIFHRGNSFHIKSQAEHMLHLWTRGARGRFSQLCAEPDTARVLVIWPWNPVQLRRGACFFPFYSPPHRFFWTVAKFPHLSLSAARQASLEGSPCWRMINSLGFKVGWGEIPILWWINTLCLSLRWGVQENVF